ncbi:lysozyme inhibitor LprI family protein [Trinickia dabaoshanensis]|nr:hypothetical protein [Trinickia dabaoshanensis]
MFATTTALMFNSAVSAAQNSAIPGTSQEPAQSGHNYVYDRDGTYGYERSPGEEERRNGTTGTPLVLASYVGHHGDEYEINIQHDYEPLESLDIRCTLPCSVATLGQIVPPLAPRVQTVAVPSTSVLSSIIKDAIDDKLVLFGKAVQGDSGPPQDAGERMWNLVNAPRPWISTPYAVSIKNPLAPSFDCKSAHTTAENLICANPDLTRADWRLAESYFIAQLVAKNQTDLENFAQRRWDERDRKCDDAACVSAWDQHMQLEFETVARTGDVAGD